jgi:hypothetical protein
MRPFLLCVLGVPLLACAEPVVLEAPSSKAEAATAARAATVQPLRARLTDDLIRQAVRETLAEAPARREPASGGQVLSSDRYQAFSRDFSESKKPSCLGPDAMKHQPPVIGTKNWNFGVGGIFALPFWAAAIVQGKCN